MKEIQRFCAAFLSPLAVFAAPLSAQEPAAAIEPAPSTSAAAAESSYVLVRLLDDARMMGYPAVCPGTSPDEDQSQIWCMAELYEVPARVIQHLGGAETDSTLTVRFTAHSFHAVWREDVRFVLGIRPFEDKGAAGHFAWLWDWENESGEFCEGTDGLDNFPFEIGDFYRAGRVRKATRRDDDWERGFEISCVRGHG